MNPSIYKLKDHKIPIDAVDKDALHCVKALQAAGHIAYIVGGGVRDLLLQKHPKDFDISTSAKPEEVKTLFKSSCLLIGKRFRLAHLRYGKKIIEVSTFRSGSNQEDKLILRDNEWGTEEEDALRRDFTINGLFYDPIHQIVIDYVNGYNDIQKSHLRTIGEPFLRFKQDPVRMIRLIKFQARFGFTVDPDTTIALAECRPEIIKSSQARIFEEILRMLESRSAEPFIRLMNEHGFLQYLTPAIAKFLEHSEGSTVYSYLHHIDTKPTQHEFDRSFLLCCIAFPFLENHIHTHYTNRKKALHLGEIQQETLNTISAIFRPFFLLPRKILMKMTSILTTQFRMTPIENKYKRPIRIPRDENFPLALDFLSLRSYIDPSLKTSWKNWNKTYLERTSRK
jgi:poly(A) polymerase